MAEAWKESLKRIKRGEERETEMRLEKHAEQAKEALRGYSRKDMEQSGFFVEQNLTAYANMLDSHYFPNGAREVRYRRDQLFHGRGKPHEMD